MKYSVQARSQSLWNINLNTQQKPIVRAGSAWELKRVANAQLVTQSIFTTIDGRPKYRHTLNVHQAKNKPLVFMGATIITSQQNTQAYFNENTGCRKSLPKMGAKMLFKNNNH